MVSIRLLVVSPKVTVAPHALDHVSHPVQITCKRSEAKLYNTDFTMTRLRLRRRVQLLLNRVRVGGAWVEARPATRQELDAISCVITFFRVP